MKHKIKQAFFIGFVLLFLISCNKTTQENENELVINLQKDNEKPFICLKATIIDENNSIEVVNFLNDSTVRAKTTYFYHSNSKLDSIIRVNFYKNKTDWSIKYQYFYDNFNRLKKETYFYDFFDETITTTYFYNAENQLIKETNEETNKDNIFSKSPEMKEYIYDNSGRVVKIVSYYYEFDIEEYYLIDYPKNQKVEYYYSRHYKENDSILNELKEKTVYDYDKKNRITKITKSNIPLALFGAELSLCYVQTYQYDKFDRVTKSIYKWYGSNYQEKYIYKYGKKWDKIDKSIINQILNTELYQETD